MSDDYDRVDEWKKAHNYRVQESDDPKHYPNPEHSCENCHYGRIRWHNCTVECRLCCPDGCQWMIAWGICDNWE